MAPPLRPIKDRFEDSYIPEPMSGCFLWVKSLDAYGYGDFIARKVPLCDGKYHKERIKAHRLAWKLRYGPIPGGKQVLHKCDVRCCVNPDHLFLGTSADNMADKIAKGRQSRGEDYCRKLTEDAMREIRASSETCVVLAARHGVTFQTVSEIRRRVIWKHI